MLFSKAYYGSKRSVLIIYNGGESSPHPTAPHPIVIPF